MDIVTGVIYFFLFLLFVIYLPFFKQGNISRNTAVIAYFFRTASSALFFVVYTFHYTNRSEADMYRYYDDGKIMYSSVLHSPLTYVKMITGISDDHDEIKEQYYMKMNTWYKSFDSIVHNDNRTIVRINAFLMLFTFGSLYAQSLLFMFLGFIGLTWIFRAIAEKETFRERLLYYSVMFFPSLVFWTSNISKEAVVIFALGGLLFFTKKMLSEPFRLLRMCLPLLFLFLLFTLKIYVLMSLIPFLTAYFMSLKKQGRTVIFRFLLVFVCYVLVLWNLHLVFPNYNIIEALIRQQQNFLSFANDINAGSIIAVPLLKPELINFIGAVPVALFNVLFRPFFFDSTNAFMLMVSFENLFFILFLIMVSIFLKKKFLTDPLFMACIGFAVFFFVVVGLVTPVMGAVVRYKIIGYPFLFAAMIKLIDEGRLRNLKNHLIKKI